MIEVLGWISTALVLVGFILNAKGIINWAMITWIIGDIGWITYDFFIDNFSHLVLSLVIISINIYGIINLKKKGLKGV
tara:strand:- start:108 stop:341 length:234 start_codon:yes stop_codon:yes gene_type:complete